MIRKARKDDAESVVKLLMLSTACVFEDILKTDDYDTQLKLAKSFFETPGTKYYHENVIVYECEGCIAGVMVYYDASYEVAYNQLMSRLIDVPYQFGVESVEDTIYIDSVAVDSNYRGRGIAQQLFAHVIETSKKDISLLVDEGNIHAQAYYKRIGFRDVGRRSMFGHHFFVMRYRIAS